MGPLEKKHVEISAGTFLLGTLVLMFACVLIQSRNR